MLRLGGRYMIGEKLRMRMKELEVDYEVEIDDC